MSLLFSLNTQGATALCASRDNGLAHLRERNIGGGHHSWEMERQRVLGRCCGTGHEGAGAAQDFCKSCPNVRLLLCI